MTELWTEDYQGAVISVWRITEVLQEARNPYRDRLILVIDGRDRTREVQRASSGPLHGGLAQEAKLMVDRAKYWIDGERSARRT